MAHYEQDEEGQWWYYYGKKYPCRTRAQKLICGLDGCNNDTFIHSNSPTTRFCSHSCASKHLHIHNKQHPFQKTGKDNMHWAGGKIMRKGYVFIFTPNHPSKGLTKHKNGLTKYIAEHRLTMEEHLGRYLHPWERVHHKNGIKNDNRIENLELWVHGHPYGQRIEDILPHCPTCTCSGQKQDS
jgi:hypothetical protein